MREIKFRAWDKEKEEMTEIININLLDEACRLMQYIGLKDKNGKEIYEGDIVKRQAYIDYENQSKINKVEGVIEMYNYSWCIVHKNEDKRYIHPLFMEEEFCNINELEIIGNIYEGIS